MFLCSYIKLHQVAANVCDSKEKVCSVATKQPLSLRRYQSNVFDESVCSNPNRTGYLFEIEL